METLCDYFDIGYKVLYSDGTQLLSNSDGIMDAIKGLANAGNRVLVVVDNVHDSKMAMIFYVIDELQSFNNIERIRFILAARQPEFKTLVTFGIFGEELKNYRDAIVQFNDNDLQYKIPYYNPDEIIAFINRYIKHTSIKDVKQKAIDIYEDTNKGHPILVKFSVLGDGLRNDVNKRFGNYLTKEDGTGKPDGIKIITAIICSLFHVSSLSITSRDLQSLDLLLYASTLDRAILYSESVDSGIETHEEENKIWKTLHVRWSLELLSFLFDHFKNDNSAYAEIKSDFQKSLEKIYGGFDGMTVLSVLYAIYSTVAVGKYIPVEVIDEVVKVPSSFTNYMKRDFYALGKGLAHDDLGKYDEGIECYDKALEIDGKYVTAWYNKGISLHDLGRYEEAIESFDKALEIDDKHVNACYNKGAVLAKLGRYDEAIEYYDKALEIDDKYVNAWNNKGVALNHLGKHKEAIRCYDRALEMDDNDAQAWYGKGYALDELGKYEEAIACYDRAIEIDDKYVNAWNNKGLALGNLGRYNEAIECYDKALEIDEKFVAGWINKGYVFYELGKYNKAIQCYDKALEIDDKNVDTWFNKGLVLGNLGKYDEEIKCYDKAIEIDEKYVDAWNNKGAVLVNLGRYDEAMECYDKALEIDEKHVDVYYSRAILKCKLNKINECLIDLKMAITLDENMIEQAREDKDFESIRDNEEFKLLLSRETKM